MLQGSKLAINFASNWLEIYNKDLIGPERERLTLKSWLDLEVNVSPKKVKGVWIKLVNIGDCCRELFTFLSMCNDCHQLLIFDVIDNTRNSGDLSHYLSVSLKKLQNLLRIDIRSTDLGLQWYKVLPAISSSDLRVLVLCDQSLRGQYTHLAATITRLRKLRLLNLNGTDLGKEELRVLSLLPHRCPRLQGLMVGVNNLSEVEQRLLEAVEGLTMLRLLIINDCSLQGNVFSSVVKKINKGIEVIAFDGNEAMTDVSKNLFKYIGSLKSLKYMLISSHLVPVNTCSQIQATISKNNGHLLVDPTMEHLEWNNYKSLLNRIRDECYSAVKDFVRF